jgi:hypothetical protein
MYRKFFTYLLLLISGSLSGQVQGYYSPDFWEKYTNALAFDLKLEPVSLQKTSFHYRFWNIGQAIDVWTDDSGLLHGEITNYAKEYDEMNLGKRTFFSSKLPIDQGIASDIYHLILSSSIAAIPAADEITGWSKNTEGFTYIAECIDSGKYSFKTYLSPGKQGSLKEALTIQSFIERLEQVLKLKKTYKSFSATIPFWCYTKGTREVTCRGK